MEHIVDTFTNGLKNLHKNPIIFLPIILITLFLTFIIVVTTSALIFLLLIPILVGTAIGSEILITASVVTILVILITMLISAYLSAGSIGMSKEAVSTGKTQFGDFFTYGTKYFFRSFIASLLLSIINALVIIFWLPMVYVFSTYGYTFSQLIDAFITSPESLLPLFTALILPALFGLLMTIIYSIIVSVLFYFILYAIVIDDIGAVASFKKSYAVLRQSFWKVILFIILVSAIVFGVTSVISFFSSLLSSVFNVLGFNDPVFMIIGAIIQLIFSLISFAVSMYLTAVVFVWTTRFYMGINGYELYTEEKSVKEDLLADDF